jgi:limonene-1,2-epoxide hydrolase
MPLAFVIEVEGRKIRKWNSYLDVASLMRQLGVQP